MKGRRNEEENPVNKTILIIVVALLVFSLAGMAFGPGKDRDRKGPIQITTDARYDRNPDAVRTHDGKIWLFYTRGRNPIGVRGVSGYDPDADVYDIYFRTARNPDELVTAPENLVPGSDLVTVNSQRDIAVVEARDKSIWLFASSGYASSADFSVFYYRYTRRDGWTGPTAVPDTAVAGHIDAVAVGDRIFLFYENWPYIVKVMSTDGFSWTPAVTIREKATLPKAVFQHDRFFLAWSYLDMDAGVWGKYIGLSTSKDGVNWMTVGPIAAWPDATNWDPVLIEGPRPEHGPGGLTLVWAPDTGSSGQILAETTARNPMEVASWSAPKALTVAATETISWWDFWPNAADDVPALFFTSESDAAGAGMIDGNIWMFRR